jgi:phosphatidylethanolamine-binding protein (PEBP) family uncharacterized protein
MRLGAIAGLAAVLLITLALSGCGAGAGTTSSPALSVPKIKLKSAAIHGTSIPALYTCDGKNVPPPLEWGPVPPGVGSLVLFVVAILPKSGTDKYTFNIAWAVAGIDPKLHKLESGRLPRGAVVGVASDGKRNYSVCPKKGTEVQYQFELYGLPLGAAVSRTFAALPIFASLETSNRSSPTDAYGALVARYNRS